MEAYFIESQSMTVQGKSFDIRKKYGNTWTIKQLGNGNGNWLLTKKSDVIVNGVSRREYILNHYGRKRLTKNLFDIFLKDVKNGLVNI